MLTFSRDELVSGVSGRPMRRPKCKFIMPLILAESLNDDYIYNGYVLKAHG